MKTSIAILVVLTAAALPATAMAQQEKKAPVPVAVGDLFPRLEAEFLSGRKAVLPDASKGKTALVLMGFTYDSRFAVEKWAARFNDVYGKTEGVTFFEVPVIGGMGRLASWFIDSGMRRGTPRELHENVITVYGNVDRWKTVMGFTPSGENDAYLALLDVDGRVTWRARGPLQDEAFAALQSAVAAELQRRGPS